MDKKLEKQQLTTCPVAWQAQQNPNAIAIETDNQKITFLMLHRHITSLSAQLITLNMHKADRLVCIANNGLSLVLLQFACLRNAFIFCPINPKFSQPEIQQRLTLLNSTFIWQEDNQDSLPLNFEEVANQETPDCAIDPVDIISIIFTSGSSGFPKPVMHHFSNHFYSASGSQSIIPLTTGDKNLLSLPLFHISGYATVMRTLLAGATLRISNKKMDTKRLIKNKITHLSLVSSQLLQLLQDTQFQVNIMSIKHLLLGGSAFPEKILIETRKRGFTYHLSYGSTEMASQIATSTNNQTLRLLPYRQLKIIDGEIQLSGATRFAGYFKEDTISGLIEKSCYFASADLGEANGEIIKVIGRKDRQFISGGENIQPEEIEKLLLSFPKLAQAYVIPINDPYYGYRPVAFIKWHEGEQLDKLKLFMQENIISFKQPLHYLTLPDQQGLKPNLKQLVNIALQRFNIAHNG